MIFAFRKTTYASLTNKQKRYVRNGLKEIFLGVPDTKYLGSIELWVYDDHRITEEQVLNAAAILQAVDANITLPERSSDESEPFSTAIANEILASTGITNALNHFRFFDSDTTALTDTPT